MADRDIQVGIQVTADTSGAEAAKQAVEEVKKVSQEAETQSTEAAKQRFEAAQKVAEETNVKELKGLDQLSDEARKALGLVDDKTKEVTVSHNKLENALHRVAHEFPVLGLAARVALNPIIGLIIAVSTGLEKVAGSFKQIQELLRMPEWTSSTGAFKAQASALDDAKVASAGFQDELRRVAERQRTIIDYAQENIDALHRQANAQASLQSAEKAALLARVDALSKIGVERGGMTEQQAAEERLRIENDFAKRAITAAKQLRASEISERIREQQTLEDGLLAAQAKLAEDEERARAAGTVQFLRAQEERARSNVEIQRKVVGELLVEQGKLDAVNLPGTTGALRKQVVDTQLANAQELLKVHEDSLATAQSLTNQRVIETETLQRQVAADREQLKAANDRLAALPRIIEQLRIEADVQNKTADAVERYNRATREIGIAPTRIEAAEALKTRTGEITQNLEGMGIATGTKAGREIGVALEAALKQYNIGVTDAVVPFVLDLMTKTTKELRAEFDAKLRVNRGSP